MVENYKMTRILPIVSKMYFLRILRNFVFLWFLKICWKQGKKFVMAIACSLEYLRYKNKEKSFFFEFV